MLDAVATAGMVAVVVTFIAGWSRSTAKVDPMAGNTVLQGVVLPRGMEGTAVFLGMAWGDLLAGITGSRIQATRILGGHVRGVHVRRTRILHARVARAGVQFARVRFTIIMGADV
jgi:hypothetical protein